MGGEELEPNEIKACGIAAELMRNDQSMVHRPEMSSFKEALSSWGGKVNAGVKQIVGDVLELESEEEEDISAPFVELKIPELEDELEDDPEVFDLDTDGKGDDDPERLPKDSAPYPPLPPNDQEEPSEARRKALQQVKEHATEALAKGDLKAAIAKYTEAIKSGGATALMLATRGALLLKQKRPCAAIRDCCAALVLNADCGKAYHVRGVSHRKLGHWKRAHRDLSKGQQLDFSEDSVSVHQFVTKKVGASGDSGKATASRQKASTPVKKAATVDRNAGGPRRTDLRDGQAVRVGGLLRAPQLNGKRGILKRVDPKDSSRFEVEIRMERGRGEIKSIKGENIMAVPAAQARYWTTEENQWQEDKRKREREERKWKEVQDLKDRQEEKRKKEEWSMGAAGFPDMDPTERLEAEMSALPLDDEAMRLLRKLRADEALEILQQAGLGGIGDMAGYVKIKARLKLDLPPEAPKATFRPPDMKPPDMKPPDMKPPDMKPPGMKPPEMRPPDMAPPGMKPPDMAPPGMRPPEMKPPDMKTPTSAAPAQAADDDDGGSSSDEDFDQIAPESEPVLEPGYTEAEPSEEQSEAIANMKWEASDKFESGDLKGALEKYIQVCSRGGASALTLTKRSEILLKLNRPLAAVADCTAAIKINDELGKAYRVRGIAYRKLGRWQEAKTDLAQGQKLDFDESVSNVQKFVDAKATKAAKKRKQDGGDEPDAKRR